MANFNSICTNIGTIDSVYTNNIYNISSTSDPCIILNKNNTQIQHNKEDYIKITNDTNRGIYLCYNNENMIILNSNGLTISNGDNIITLNSNGTTITNNNNIITLNSNGTTISNGNNKINIIETNVLITNNTNIITLDSNGTTISNNTNIITLDSNGITIGNNDNNTNIQIQGNITLKGTLTNETNNPIP